MAYIPKSKIKIHQTLGDEFLNKISKRPYKGPYIETSDSKFYAGNNSSQLSLELIPLPKTHFRGGNSEDYTKYKNIKPDTHTQISSTTTIIGTKPKPTEDDYVMGSFIRYFIKRINSNTKFTEIDDITFLKINREDPEYDYNLYQTGAIKWALRGDVININNLAIKRQRTQFPSLINLFPQSNEYQNSEDIRPSPSNLPFIYRYTPPTGGGGY